MKIDYSGFALFNECPLKYYERHIHGVTLDAENEARALGKRVHELLEERNLMLKGTFEKRYGPHKNALIENEALAILAAYNGYYPVEPFTVVDVEKTFEVKLTNEHSLIGKLDGIVRDNATGQLQVLEHKTEKRGSSSNLLEAWAVRTQVGLYLWAAEQIYNEKFKDILLDVIVRPSPKGQVGASFWRDTLQRSPEQIEEALYNVIYVANQIETLSLADELLGLDGGENWPTNRERCIQGRWKCEYYNPHLYGWTDEIASKYKLAENYLTQIEGVQSHD